MITEENKVIMEVTINGRENKEKILEAIQELSDNNLDFYPSVRTLKNDNTEE
tara:strand:- start:276 stop:431 length:156 start_codon:yes stop_codon:yes gene_type:complete